MDFLRGLTPLQFGALVGILAVVVTLSFGAVFGFAVPRWLPPGSARRESRR